jgi:hypothetical protein
MKKTLNGRGLGMQMLAVYAIRATLPDPVNM